MGQARYSRFDKLDGSHDFKKAVPGGFVDYAARRLPGGEVVWFNFDLGREMGLIPSDHGNTLNSALRRQILDTFCLTIINEHDLDRGRRRGVANCCVQADQEPSSGSSSGVLAPVQASCGWSGPNRRRKFARCCFVLRSRRLMPKE